MLAAKGARVVTVSAKSSVADAIRTMHAEVMAPNPCTIGPDLREFISDLDTRNHIGEILG